MAMPSHSLQIRHRSWPTLAYAGPTTRCCPERPGIRAQKTPPHLPAAAPSACRLHLRGAMTPCWQGPIRGEGHRSPLRGRISPHLLHCHRGAQCGGGEPVGSPSRGRSDNGRARGQRELRRPLHLLTVNSCIKVRLDLQADKSSVVVKGPFFP
jgi:hypothetical protein